MKNNIRKSARRWLALVMTAIMLFAMATTVMATDETQGETTETTETTETSASATVVDKNTTTTVTIYKKGEDNTTKTGNVYAAYKVLDFTVSGGVYVDVTVCEPFDSVIPGSDSTINAWMAAYASGEDIAFDSSTMQSLANSLAAVITDETTAAATSSDGVITLPSTGYYLLVETAHNDDLTIETRYILIAAEGEATSVHLKDSETSITKKIVLEDETETNRIGTAVDGASEAATRVDDDVVAIGDTVTYEITATIPSYPDAVKTYIKNNSSETNNSSEESFTDLTFEITDVMSKGLTYSGATVKIGETTLTKGTGYTISNSTDSDSGETTVTINISSATVLANGGATVTVTLTATLNSSANYGATGNPNSVDLTYTNTWDTQGKPADTDTTPEDTVITYTGDFFIQKTDDDANDPQNLSGVKFKIVTSTEANATALAFTKLDNGKYIYTPAGGEETVTELEDDGSGKIEIIGLNNGTYYAVETQAPDGYNIDETPQTITLKAAADEGVSGLENGQTVSESTTATTGSGANSAIQTDNTIKWTVDANKTTNTLTITNHAGTTLPGTGGIGTTIFTFGGLALVILAAIMFIVYTKKQRKHA